MAAPPRRPRPPGRRPPRAFSLPVRFLIALLPGACAAPAPDDPAAVLAEVMAGHQANLAGLATPPRPAHPAEGGTPPPPPAPATSRAPAPRGSNAAAAAALGLAPSYAGQLVGHGPDTLLRWLGPPRLRRAEGSAEIWHYQASACHLDLVLYPEETAAAPLRAAPGPLRVAFASARATGTANRSESACLRDLARPGAPATTTTRPAPAGPGA